jgi:hypothetical protein
LRCKRRAGEAVRSPPTPSPAASQVASLHLLVSHSEASHPAGAGSFPARARARARAGNIPFLRPSPGLAPARICARSRAAQVGGAGSPPRAGGPGAARPRKR